MVKKKGWASILLVLFMMALAGCGGQPAEQPPAEAEYIVAVTGADGTVREVDLGTLETVTLTGGYLKSTGTIVGPAEVTGVRLSEVLAAVGGLEGIDAMRVTATDGYGMALSADQLSGLVDAYGMEKEYLGVQQFEALLILSSELPELMNEPPRIGFIGENLSYGPMWTQMVASLAPCDASEVKPVEGSYGPYGKNE